MLDAEPFLARTYRATPRFRGLLVVWRAGDAHDNFQCSIISLVRSGFACLCLSGCAVAPSAFASRVQEADAQMIASCKYIGEVQGSSGWGNLAASAGMENAKNEARENAAKLGATHVL